jgi:sphinganine-1-phosphate aldolase
MRIPNKGIARDELFQRLEAFRVNDFDWRSGRAFGYVFDPGREAMEVGKQAYNLFMSENALDFTVFPSLLHLENEIVAMASAHLGGDDTVVGSFSSGGTESIILAVKTARDYFRERRPDIGEPEMVLPASAHAAFHKAGHYLKVKVVQVPVDPQTFKADVDIIRDAITPNTILLVGSVPSYALGVIDPIRDLGRLALDHDILLHVDACMGGFILPYFRRLKATVPDFDFSVPGVTSISMDLHKYAYTPKGASVVLYRSKELRRHQIFACSRWIGYTMVNNAVQSTKSGGPMAAAWAVLNYIGDDGYLELARKKLDATRRIAEGIKRIDGLRLVAEPEMCLLAFTSDTASAFHIIDEMSERGWYIQPALAFGTSKEHIHLSINASNVGCVDELLADLRASVEAARTMSSGEIAAGVNEFLSSIDPSQLDDEAFSRMLEMAGIQGTSLPKRMADINEILNTLPVELRERLLIEFVNELFRYRKYMS